MSKVGAVVRWAGRQGFVVTTNGSDINMQRGDIGWITDWRPENEEITVRHLGGEESRWSLETSFTSGHYWRFLEDEDVQGR